MGPVRAIREREAPRRRADVRRTLLILVVVGLVLRVAWWWIAHPEPVSDFLGYRSIAERLVHAGEYSRGGVTTAFRTPGYPAFLGLGILVWDSDRWLSLLNVAVSTAAIPLTAWFAFELGLGRRVLVASAALVALIPTFVLWAPVLASEHLQVALTLVAWSLSCRTTSWRRAVGTGAVFGIAVLVRPESIFFLLAVPLLLRVARVDRRRILSLAAVTFATAGLVVAPWYLRNEVVVGRGTGLSTSGGLNFYLAHRTDGYRFVEPARTPLRGLDEIATNREGYALGVRTIRSDPARLASTTLRYTYELFRAPTYAAHYSTRRDGVTPYRSTVPHPAVETAKGVATAGWVVTLVLVPVGIVGLWLGGRRRAFGALGALLAANWLCFTVVFWGMPRYRYAVEPVLAILAAVGLTVLRDRLTVDTDSPGSSETDVIQIA